MKLIVSTLFLALIMLSITINLFHIPVFAHNFKQNQDSIFFGLVKQYEVENILASRDNQINKSNSLEHSNNADQLMKHILFLNKDVKNISKFLITYKSAFDDLNATTKALVAANLADGSLREYGRAIGLDLKQSSNLLNMTMNMGGSMNNMSAGTGSMNHALNSANEKIVNQSNLETSKMLAYSLKSLYTNQLRNSTIEKSKGLMEIPIQMKLDSIKDLRQGIDNLLTALDRKARLQEVVNIVHGQIHPNLFLGFDLKLRVE